MDIEGEKVLVDPELVADVAERDLIKEGSELLTELRNTARRKISARALWRAGFQGKHVASKRSIDDIRTENRKANKAARKTRAAQRKVAKGK